MCLAQGGIFFPELLLPVSLNWKHNGSSVSWKPGSCPHYACFFVPWHLLSSQNFCSELSKLFVLLNLFFFSVAYSQFSTQGLL